MYDPLTAGRGFLFFFGMALAFSVQAAKANPGADEMEIGRRIYQDGILPSGAPLKGVRTGGTEVSGSAAACMNCHRRSGMGSVEGDIQVPPITGNYLFGYDGNDVAAMDPRSGKAFNQKHAPYTDESLAHAIRYGKNNSRQETGLVMPRYTLGNAEIKALIVYLRQLSAQWSPGVTAQAIRFATVVAPGVEDRRRKVLLEMMRTAFAQKNGSTITGGRAGGRRHMVSAAEMILGTERKWELDVWELQGPPEGWAAQLEKYYHNQPVFAIVSGLSNTSWEPVHNFCEREHLPCWFPSVDLPPAATQAFYPVYFSRGVALEADILAKHLLSRNDQQSRRLVQVYRDDYVGRGAAQALWQTLVGSGITVKDRILRDGSPEALRDALAEVQEKDDIMFWLRPDDLAVLEKVAPPQSASIYFSARLASGEHGFPATWKKSARLIYPYDRPERREANLAYFHAWLKQRKLELVDEPLQSEVYFALNFLTDTLAEMLNNLYRDYLMERAEDMIGRREGSKAEEAARNRPGLGWPNAAATQAGNTFGRQESTTIYPRLSLGTTQRFASKGGYIMHFAGTDSDELIAESGWVIP